MLFSHIIGQDMARRFLTEVVHRKRIPHAYLFTGIPGIGKTSMARALTLSLNCLAPVDMDGCGRCAICRQFYGGNFPDLQVIEPDGQNIKIEQIREFNARLAFAPLAGKYRVCILQKADALNQEAANALLKTLEEPPARNILILIATEPRDLLPTIVSRCQRVPFQPLPVEAMVRWLVEHKNLISSDAEVLARNAGGSLGRAMAMGEAGFVEKRKVWIEAMLSLVQANEADALEIGYQMAEKVKKEGKDVAGGTVAGLIEGLEIWAFWYRDLILLASGHPPGSVINGDYHVRLKSLHQRFRMEVFLEAVAAIDLAGKALVKMGNASLVMEHAAMRLQTLMRGA